MKKLFLIAKWELKEKFLHKSFIIYFFISQFLLFLTISLTGDNSEPSNIPKTIGIISPSTLNTSKLIKSVNESKSLIIKINKNDFLTESGSLDYEKLLFAEHFDFVIENDTNGISLYYSGFIENSKVIEVQSILLNTLSADLFNNSKFNLKKITPIGNFSITTLINKLGINLIFIFIILVSGNLFLRSFSYEKSNKIIEILLSSTSSNILILGKSIGLLIFVLIQLFFWLLTSSLFGNSFINNTLFNVETLSLFFVGLTFYVTVFTGLGTLINYESDTNLVMGIISLFLIIPLLVIKEIIFFPNSIISTFLTYFPFTSTSTLIIKSGFLTISRSELIISLSLLLFSIFLISKTISFLFERSIQNLDSQQTFWKFSKKI